MNQMIYLIHHHPRTAGIITAVLGAILMSFDPIFIRFSGVSGFDTAFLFGLFTAISMPIFIQWRDPRGLIKTLQDSGVMVLIMGLLMLGSASGLVLSVKLTSITNVFVILSASPALSALLSWLILREVTQKKTWIAIIFVMLGIFIVVSQSFQSGHWQGDALAIFAVICISLNRVMLRKYPQVSRMASVGFGGFFLAIVMFFFATPSTYSINTWLIMAIMGLFTAPFGRVLNQVATRYITAAEVGIVEMLKTAIAPLLAYLFFQEIPTQRSLVGGVIILLTVTLYSLSVIRKRG